MDITIQEAENILMNQDIEPPKQNSVWVAIKWLVKKFFGMLVCVLKAYIISFWIVIVLLLCLPYIVA